MTTPRDNDDSARDRDQPTEYLETGHPGYTSDPTQAYGRQEYRPTEALPTGDYYGNLQDYPQQNYTGQQGYPQQNYTGQQGYPQQGYPQQPPQYGEAPFLDDGNGKDPKSPKTALIVLAALVVLAVVGFGAYLVFDSQSSSRTAAPAITPRSAAPTTTPPSTTLPAPTSGSLPGLDSIPGGLGEALGSQGASIGTITSNDGTTIVMDGIGGSSVTVVTDANTQIVALGASTVADLQPGTSIVVQGTPLADGRITAEVIVSTGIGFN
jgi:hypothetical protein